MFDSRRLKKAVRIIRQDGPQGIVNVFVTVLAKMSVPVPAKYLWRAGIRPELEFWDEYFRTKGAEWSDIYGLRFDPGLPLQPRPAALLPDNPAVHILDVGAGPLTCLGKKIHGKQITITAVDALADEYDRILDKYNIRPPVRTEKLDAEKLTWRFSSGTFDLVFARNCIDHAYDPETAILQMIDVVKPGACVLLEHRPNEAENMDYYGLHQWNFSVSPEGDFCISSKRSKVNMTKKYAKIARISCEIVHEERDGDMLVTRILKR